MAVLTIDHREQWREEALRLAPERVRAIMEGVREGQPLETLTDRFKVSLGAICWLCKMEVEK